MPKEPVVEPDGTDFDEKKRRRTYGAGAVTLFGGWAATLLMFAWPLYIALIITGTVSIAGFYWCFRAVLAIEQKVAKEDTRRAFLSRIRDMKRIAYLMIPVMLAGEFLLATFIQASIEAGPEAIQALYNLTFDNAFEIGGGIGFLICSVGMFGFLYATAYVEDNYSNISSDHQPNQPTK